MRRQFIDLFNKFWDKRSRDVVIGCIGRIESFDKTKMRADVQPLLEYTSAGSAGTTKFSVIGDVPVQFLYSGGFYIRPHYEAGDLVWVTYSTFGIESGLNNTFDDVSVGAFSRENASVTSGIARENWTAPKSFNDDGLLIGCKDGITLQITQNDIVGKGNKISWDGDFEITGASEPAVLGDTLISILDSFCDGISKLAADPVTGSGTAIIAINTAALALKGKLNTIKASKVKIK